MFLEENNDARAASKLCGAQQKGGKMDKEIVVIFESADRTKFKVDARDLTHRELLVLAQRLKNEHIPIGRLEYGSDKIVFQGHVIFRSKNIQDWQVQLVADEFYLAAMHKFFAIQNQAMIQAAQRQAASQIVVPKPGFLGSRGQ
jgi:hypothetical protein